MLYNRDNPRNRVEQEKRITLLVQEAMKGVTKKDILREDGIPLVCEYEAMYFNKLREFSKTTLAHRIMEVNQDIFREEVIL